MGGSDDARRRVVTEPTVGAEPIHDDHGEMCVLHKTTLKSAKDGAGIVMVSCRTGCPGRRPNRERRRT